ncbi:MAG: hypothetical protein DRJ61_07070 [Acidobacteria bacterium]|nr:MAG: hypothetical protein DRJ61_07070 [Acidobacteriota bacterium]
MGCDLKESKYGSGFSGMTTNGNAQPISEAPAQPWTRLATLALVLILVLSSGMVFYHLGDASFLGDEAIYALVSRETVNTGVWFPLHVGGQLYLDKPPLKISLVTALFSVFGESEFVARFPDAVFGVATIALVFVFGFRRFGLGVGVVAALVLLGAENYLCLHGVRESVQDSFLTLMSAVICCVWFVNRNASSSRARSWIAVAVAILAAGLVKNIFGLIFAILLLVIEGVFWIIERRRPAAFRPAVAMVVTVAAGMFAYVILMQWATDGLFIQRLHEDVVVRAMRGVDAGHLHGPTFYLESVFSDFGLWLIFVLPALVGVVRRARSLESQITAGLIFWSIGIIGGFSFSASKLPWYVYPAYPALVLVIAFGTREVVSILATRTHRAVAVMLITVAVAFHLGGTWKAVEADVQVIDSQRFVREYSKLDDAMLIVDEPSLSEGGRFREWNRFYLAGAPGVRWLSKSPARIQPPLAECVFLATGDPLSHLPTKLYPWRVTMVMRSVDRFAPKIWILGTCGLDVPDMVGAGKSIFAHLIRFEDFEAGDSALLTGEFDTGDHSIERVYDPIVAP